MSPASNLDPDSLQLLESVRSGDDAAAEELFERYFERLGERPMETYLPMLAASATWQTLPASDSVNSHVPLALMRTVGRRFPQALSLRPDPEGIGSVARLVFCIVTPAGSVDALEFGFDVGSFVK